MAQVQVAEAGTVVPFKPAVARSKRAGAAETGRILLFTGVRYERPVVSTISHQAERSTVRS